MKKLVLVVVSLCVLALAGFASSGQHFDVEADRAALVAADAGHLKSFKSGDVDEIFSFYDAEAILFPPCGGSVEGETQRQGTQAFLESGGEVNYEMDRAEVASGGGMGYTYGRLQVITKGADGQPVTQSGWNTHVWKKQDDGSWKIIVDTWTSDAPGCDAAE